MVVVALLALLLLALVAIGVLGRAHHALRSGARSAAEADPVTGLPGRPRFRADLDARLAEGGPTTLLLARLRGFAAHDAAFRPPARRLRRLRRRLRPPRRRRAPRAPGRRAAPRRARRGDRLPPRRHHLLRP